MARTNTSGAALPVTYTLLKTKTQVPNLRGAFVERPLLFERLDADFPLTVVCAPPGSGKTALLARWAAGQGEAAAWLSLDELDNDLSRFLAYLAAAVHAADETLTAVLNALSDSPLALVLDNYQMISNAAIHDALTFMIDHLPPARACSLPGAHNRRCRWLGIISLGSWNRSTISPLPMTKPPFCSACPRR